MHFRHETAARQNDRPHGVVAVAAVGDAAAAVVEGDRKAAVGAGAAAAKRLLAVDLGVGSDFGFGFGSGSVRLACHRLSRLRGKASRSSETHP